MKKKQNFIQPISPPGSEVYIEKKKIPYPVDWSGFGKKTTKYMTAYMDEYGLPRYKLIVWEDIQTRERVVSLDSTGYEVARIPAPTSYDPDSFYQDMLLKGAAYHKEMSWVFDPAHTAISIELIPESLYSAYEQYETEKTLALSMEAMLLAPPPPDGSSGGTGDVSYLIGSTSNSPLVGMTIDSNSVVTMDISVPDSFGGEHLEIFSKDNLVYSPSWQIAESWLPTYGSVNVSWTDTNTGSKTACFYIISDADDDADGDGYSALREILFEGTSPTNFNLVNVDGDNIPDWYEWKLFGSLDQTGTNDFDGDGLLNNEERVFASGLSSPPTLFSDPVLSDTDGDGMDDYLETITYPFLDPRDPSDRDYDHDKLDNWDELQLGTSITNWDTDADSLSDGQEIAFGTDPKTWDGPGSDYDGDGLVLSNEFKYGTNPNIGGGDTDGDGTSDYDEVNQGSSPTSAADGGVAPDPSDLIEIRLAVGDHSSSMSERYCLVLNGERTIRHRNTKFDEV